MKISKERQLFDNRALVALIIPLIIEQFLAVLVGMADSIMVASVGEAAVSGVSLVDNIVVLLINIFSALATGGAVVAGQYLGRKREEEACKSAGQLVWFVTISAVGVTAIVYLCKSFILHGVFGKIEADVMAHANTYLVIVTASIPFIALYNGGAAIFRAMGDSKIPDDRVHDHERDQCEWKCNFNLWLPLRNRRCGNSYTGFQSSCSDSDHHSFM